MRRLSAGFATMVIAVTFSACSQTDNERARRKGDEAKQQLHEDLGKAKEDLSKGSRQAREDLRKADDALTRNAEKFKHDVNKDVNKATDDTHR